MPNQKEGEWSCNRIEKEVKILYKYIDRALDKVCPKRECKSKKEHPWWDEECELRKNILRRAEQRVRVSGFMNCRSFFRIQPNSNCQQFEFWQHV